MTRNGSKTGKTQSKDRVVGHLRYKVLEILKNQNADVSVCMCAH